MKELSKTNRLTIVVSAIVLVFIVGLLTLRKPDVQYNQSPEGMLTALADTANYLLPSQLKRIVEANDGKSVLIDVRNSIAYGQNHIGEAKNIPVRELFTPENLKFLRTAEKNNQQIILYGESPQQANGAWMMLKQTGFSHAVMVNSSFGALNRPASDSIPVDMCMLRDEPRIDTAALSKLRNPAPAAEKPVVKAAPKKTVLPAPVQHSSGGGC